MILSHELLLPSRKQKSPTPFKRGLGVDDFGAGEMNRTPDLLITNELLYRLSYTGTPNADYNGVDKLK